MRAPRNAEPHRHVDFARLDELIDPDSLELRFGFARGESLPTFVARQRELAWAWAKRFDNASLRCTVWMALNGVDAEVVRAFVQHEVERESTD